MAVLLAKKPLAFYTLWIFGWLISATIMAGPGIWLLGLGRDPERFCITDWERRSKWLVYGWLVLTTVIATETTLSIIDGQLEVGFLLVELPALLIFAVCLSIVQYCRNWYNQKPMLPAEGE
jgi:hypothetical protein